MFMSVGLLATSYWLAAVVAVFPLAIYPALLTLWARRRPRPARRDPSAALPGVSVLVAAYNEEHAIARRVAELAGHMARQHLEGELIVVSDGSTDGTVAAARREAPEGFCQGIPMSVLALSENAGKAAALTAGARLARFPVIALADARQRWADDALTRLLENFADPEVGAVSGELMLESSPGVLAGVGLYWTFEKWLRAQEGLVHSTVGLTGAICAARRELFEPVPPGTILDDVYWPLRVVMNGHRVVFDGRARAFDRLPENVGAEYRRKVRTLAGNFQLVARMPEALLPWRNPVWFPLLAHKLSRLTMPWALLAMLALAAALGGPLYTSLLAAEVAGLLMGLAGLAPAVGKRSRLASAAASFLTLNAAAWHAFWVWITGRAGRSWTKTIYATTPSATPARSHSPCEAVR